MKRFRIGVLCACAGLGLVAAAEEATVKSNIVSVGLFKNGLAVVRREVQLPGPGTFVVGDAPEPVHGTWWVESSVPIETRMTMREVSEPLRVAGSTDFQSDLAGKQVTIHFRDGQIPPATGKVEALATPKEVRSWRASDQPAVSGAAAGTLLILQTENGRIFVDPGMIAYLRADGKEVMTTKHRQQVLRLTAGKELEKPTTIFLSYLAKGLSWAPSYRVDIADPKTLTIEQAAVIKNELADLEGAEIQLITGFPSMKFSHVASPLSLRTDMHTFFEQLGEDAKEGTTYGCNAAAQVGGNMAPELVDINSGAALSGEGIDLHCQSIGARSLKEGDSLALSVAKETAPYERIVEYLIPDNRDENGYCIEQQRRELEKLEDTAWESLRFKNPFKFPMTTAPVMVVAGARFNGQQMTQFASSGEETLIRVNKVLNVRKRQEEQEEEGKRDHVRIHGRDYLKAVVKGELAVNNHRNEDVTIVLRRRFSGELLNADGDPKKTLLPEGVCYVNPRYELVWTFVLKPGEQKKMIYRYSLLIRE